MIMLGLVQASATSDALQNLDTMKQFVFQAKDKGCTAVCFPEAFLTGYFPQNADALALSSNCSLLNQVTAFAQHEAIDILVGFMERKESQFYLTHGIFYADGKRRFYQKTHLGEREKNIFSAGNSLPVFPLSCGLTVGIQLCVETHFPEITQTLALRGAQIIFAPHAVPRAAGERFKIWPKYIPARSYDNRVYMACCNQWDVRHFGGGCLVTDPNGEIIASCYENQTSLLCFTIEHEKMIHYRNHRYYPSQRRKDLYDI